MKVLITQGSIWSQLSGPPEAIELVRQALTVQQPKAKFVTAFKFGTWDGTIKFLRRPYNTFLTGLTDRVTSVLSDYAVKIKDGGGLSGKPLTDRLTGIDLRRYQIVTVEHAVIRRRLAIQAPTGSGKTEIGAEIARRLGRPTLWLTHRKVLMYQTYDRLRELLGVGAGVALNDHWTGAAHPINVCMVQTLSKVPTDSEFWKYWKVLIIDEAHTMTADTWFGVALRCTNAIYRFGLSGTVATRDPVRDMKLEGATGSLYVAAETQELAEQGFLATPRIVFAHPDPQSFPTYEQIRQEVFPEWRENPRALRKMGGKLYNLTYQKGILNNKHHLDAILYLMKRHRGEKILILFTDIQHGHGKRIYEHAQQYFANVYYADGNTKDTDREAMIVRFKKVLGSGVFVASTIFDQGVNIPEIDILILAGGGQSHITALQRVGRALRPRPDKTAVLIYDLWAGRKSGGKDYLANHSAAREQEYKNQGFSVKHLHL